MFWLGLACGVIGTLLTVFGILMWISRQDLREEDKEREAHRKLEDGGEE